MKCVKCGREIPDGNMYCGYCAIEEQVSLDGTKQSNTKKYLKRNRFILLGLIVLTLVVLIYNLKKKSYEYNIDAHIDKNGLFLDIPWGLSVDETLKMLKEKTKLKPRKEDDGRYTIRGKNYDSMKGVNVAISSFFNDDTNELETFGIYIFENEKTGYDVITLRDKYVKKLIEVYGKPNSEYDGNKYEWSSINGAVRLRVWDDENEENGNQIAIIYSDHYSFNSKGEAKGLFNSIDWHSTQDVFAEKIKEKLGKKVDVEDDKVSVNIKDYNGWDGVDVEIVGNYLSDYLIKISCEHKFDSKAKYSLEELKTLYKIKFDDFFGEPEEDTFKDTLTRYTWQTPTGSICLLFDEEKEILTLDYNEEYAKIMEETP